jgi:hypothetical protein
MLNRVWTGSPLFLLVVALLGCPSPQRPELTFSPLQLPEAHVGESYQATITISGTQTPVGEIHLSQGSLPRGLNLAHAKQTNTAEITGRPEEAGRWTFTVSVWCFGTQVSGQSGARTYELIVR